MSKRVGYAVLVLFALAAIPGWLGLFWQVHETNANQAEQRRQGLVIERKLCADISTMALIPPPAGNPAANPSRAYEDDEHRAWAGLVRDIGCNFPRK